jgi:hypothetical protein
VLTIISVEAGLLTRPAPMTLSFKAEPQDHSDEKEQETEDCDQATGGVFFDMRYIATKSDKT